MRSLNVWIWLLRKELRELAASRSYWLLLLVVGALVGHGFITSVSTYGEASGIGGGPAALSQGLSPLEGFVVPTWGAYDLAATLLFPFVVIRLVAVEKQTGALTLMLQAPVRFSSVMAAKSVALIIGWIAAFVPGLAALSLWRGLGGHLYTPETATVIAGHFLRGVLTIGIGAAAGALAVSSASAAIVALTITLGTWALDYVAAARGGALQALAAYTPSAALRFFEQGEIRVNTVLVLALLGLGGVAVAAVWLREGQPVRRRSLELCATLVVLALACLGAAQLRQSTDASEDRRNSFSRADEAALRQIHGPLHVTVYLAAEDPRLSDLERGVLAKLRRTMDDVEVTYAAKGRTGLFTKPDEHYGEMVYEIGGKKAVTRSTTEEIVLETIYGLAGRTPPLANEPAYHGYPLAATPRGATLVFFVFWPVIVFAVWWWLRSPPRRQQLNFAPAGG